MIADTTTFTRGAPANTSAITSDGSPPALKAQMMPTAGDVETTDLETVGTPGSC